ncbi:hypothetical protein Ccrd_025380 [Cynara cardunculus var. scolymus]|uniref:Uncharacterized protein n=1 Tax=Cynara cardunculus var. scolymus TaxID=59895 RepID=A0A103XAZ8_CYNCS|nr:hypothetical protein Ccrd_025380 [Cynara cardunculus var. scolymus]
MATSNDIQAALKPFHQRASDAEERLARLEAAIATTKDSGNEELSNKALKEVKWVTEENAKLRYRITHLVRALEKADSDLASK